MVSRVAILVMATLIGVTAAADQQSQSRAHKWWQDEPTKRALSLTDQQSSQVEDIFQASLPGLRELKKTLDALETDLSALIRNGQTDETVVTAKIDEAERTRAELNKTRTLMLYRMHKALTPDQNQKLKQLFDQRERERKGKSNQRHP